MRSHENQDALTPIGRVRDRRSAVARVISRSRAGDVEADLNRQTLSEAEVARQDASRGDAATRPALRLRLLGKHGQDADVVLIEELWLQRGHVRTDIAVVNGLLRGHEIKSDRDNLRRLGTQVQFYSQLCRCA